MGAALILLLAIVVVGAVLYVHHRLTTPASEGTTIETGTRPDAAALDAAAEEGCCGMHVTCERDSLLSSVSEEIEYFDDEELDRYAGRAEDSYTEAEADEFRDVLLSMPADNIAAWARSLQLRGIILPRGVRDELLLIVSEARAERAAK